MESNIILITNHILRNRCSIHSQIDIYLSAVYLKKMFGWPYCVGKLFFKKGMSHESVSLRQTFLPCGRVLSASLTCAAVAVCVCPCVLEGCLFCLPLCIALSCPFLSQLEKGTTPLRPRPCVSVCVASVSWDFGTSIAVTVPQQ